MSLVGSLEDLGLGEILQIVSLSGKSGVLWIRSPFGEGHIHFDRGAIRGAVIDGGPTDLAALLAQSGALPEAELETLVADARSEGAPLEDVLVARTALDAARLDELRERHVEATVLRMFSWPRGEFSFEIRDEPASSAEELLLRAGINAQFLALEGARLRDETVHERAEAGESDASSEDEEAESDDEAADALRAADPLFDAPDGGAELEITVLELLEDEGDAALPEALEADAADAVVVDEDPTLTGEAHAAIEALAAKPVEVAVEAPPASPTATPPADPAPRACVAAVLIDRDLAVLEWAKHAIAPLGLRAHIFPRSELAIQRIRQYFVRGELPLLVLSSETPADPVSGARDWAEIAARMRAQVPHLPIVLIANAGVNIVPTSERGVPDAVATRPPASVLADERARERREALAGELRDAIATATRRPSPVRQTPPRDNGEPMRVLREWSARLRDQRDPSPPSDVLRLVLDFAGRHFDRALVFWVRDGEAHAVAQRGFAAAGTPEDAAIAATCFGTDALPAFRKVLEGRAPARVAVDAPADAGFLARLGAAVPTELYVAPIESGDQVAALLYADNGPSGRALGDTSAIEVMVHEAGLALDRAVLERALEQVEGQRRGSEPDSRP